jgi:hypothetical protein
MVMKIITCGCSFSTGLYQREDSSFGTNKNYTEFLSELLNSEVTNLAIPGASNYCIIKQVEHAIEYKADLVIFNTTTTERFDVVEKNDQKKIPKFEDFILNLPNNNNGNIRSNTFNTLLKLSEIDSFYKDYLTYYITYINSYIHKDQQVLMLHGIIKKLIDHNTSYIVLDFANLLNQDKNIVKQFYHKIMCIKFPNNKKDIHWNEDGNKEIAKFILENFKDYFQ